MYSVHNDKDNGNDTVYTMTHTTCIQKAVNSGEQSSCSSMFNCGPYKELGQIRNKQAQTSLLPMSKPWLNLSVFYVFFKQLHSLVYGSERWTILEYWIYICVFVLPLLKMHGCQAGNMYLYLYIVFLYLLLLWEVG